MILILCAGLLLFLGFIGCFLPVIPGPPLAWGGLLVAFICPLCNISVLLLAVTAVIAVAVTILDNVAPAWLTKKAGGSRPAIIGSTIGLIAGIFINPVFIIIGPFIGALVGELVFADKSTEQAFKSALAAFGGFILGTGAKIIVVAIFVWFFVQSFSSEVMTAV